VILGCCLAGESRRVSSLPACRGPDRIFLLLVGLTRGELQVATGRSEEVVAVVVEEEVGKRGGR